jgi:hypothetical protein
MIKLILIKRVDRYALYRDDRLFLKWFVYDTGCYVWGFFKGWHDPDIISEHFYNFTGRYPILDGNDGIVDTVICDKISSFVVATLG